MNNPVEEQQSHKPLEINHLSKKYGSFTAVNNVSFSIEPGEIFGLLGPNGAGKTTIISCITTLEEPTQGEVNVFGHNVVSDTKNAKFNVGVVPQEIVNHGFFSVREILKIHSGYYGVWENSERNDFLLKRLSLWEHKDKKVKQLSGGMKRRLMIAKALVHSPKILLLDEPTAGVDIELRENLWEFVRELQSEGMSILLTTHYLEEAEELCDRIGILQNGHLRKVDKTKNLLQELTQRHVSIQLNKEASDFESPYLIEKKEDVLKLQIPSDLSVGQLLHELKLEMTSIKDLQIQEGSLEDAFRNILHDKQGAASAT